MPRVLISGITGFLGSHIAEILLSAKFQVIGLKREYSNIWRCEEFKEKISWVNIDNEEKYKKILSETTIDFFIHSAWIGVNADERNDNELQSQNIFFFNQLLQIANAAEVKKIIFLGSQEEYGFIDGIVSEDKICNASTAYGKTKLESLKLLESFATTKKISWVWLRLFSLFGEKQDITWLIPALIIKMKENHEMDFTLAEQKYAYLYVRDFAKIILEIINLPIESGIYNISSNNAIAIKLLVEKIRDSINPNFRLNFGALEYRKNQSMHIEGSVSKITKQIGDLKLTDFNVALENTISYYKK